MPVNVIRDPYQTLPSTSDVSKWVAIHNNVIFKFQRADFAVTSTSNSGGNTSINIGAGGVPTLTVGGRVWVKLASGVTGYYSIISNTGSAIVINLAWTSSTTGIVNLYTDYSNYVLNVSFESSSDLGANYTVEGTAQYQADPDYYIQVNAKPFLKQTVSIQNTVTPSAINEIETGADKLCRMVITEEYDAPSGHVSQTAVNNQILIAMNAANQIGYSTYAENMRAYLTSDDHTVAFDFLSDFAEPTRFEGYPFALFFIYSDLMLNSITYAMRETEYAGATAGTATDYSMDTSKYFHVNKYKMNGSYGATTTKVRVQCKRAATSTFYSNPLYVRLKTCTAQSPVCIRWSSPDFGTWQYWVFDGNQTEDMNVQNSEGEFEQYNADLSTATSDSLLIEKESTQRYTVGADFLDTNDFNGLKKILRSARVQMLTNPSTWTAGNDTWIDIKIRSHKLNRETKHNGGSMELTFDLPKHINVRN